MCKCNPESMITEDLDRKLNHLTGSVSRSYGPRPNTRKRIKILESYKPCICNMKFIDIKRAKNLQESIGLFTNHDASILEEEFVLTNSKDANDIHDSNEDFQTALKQYHESLNILNTILKVS